MALLERVTTLIKANINDLVDRAENPEKLLKQLLLDMQNQYMQVKTQVAIAIAHQHLLEKKQQENLTNQQDWVRKAELAFNKDQEDLARVALERSLTYEEAARNFGEQMADQSHQVRSLRDALHQLEQKMTETKAKGELLLAQHRRARLSAQTSGSTVNGSDHDAALDRVRAKVMEGEAMGYGLALAGGPSADQQLAALERTEQVDRLLAALKTKRIAG